MSEPLTEGNIKATLASIVSQFVDRAREDEFQARISLARAKAAVEEAERHDDDLNFGITSLRTDKIRAEEKLAAAQTAVRRWRQISDWTFEQILDACPVEIKRDVQMRIR